MFRNPEQRAAVAERLCHLLMRDHHREDYHFWTPTGPTAAATTFMRRDKGSQHDRRVLGIAWAIWGGEGRHDQTTFGQVFGAGGLSSDAVVAVGSLMVAMARTPEDIDAWLALATPQTLADFAEAT